jgi:hypothetical protein
MAIRVWNGATGDWTTDADWTPATPGNDVPNPGDSVTIASGTVILTANTGPNQLFEENAVTLGSGAAGATLLLRDTRPTGRYFSVAIAGTATIEADGIRGFAGSVTGSPNDGSTITLKADPGGELVLLHGGSFNIADREVDFDGAVTLERNAMIAGNIVNNGTLSILSGTTTFAENSFTGTGTIDIGSEATVGLEALASTQTVSFSGTGGVLALSYNNLFPFLGTVENFQPGDLISFTTATSAAIDAVAHTLTINDTSGDTYLYHNFYGEAGALTVTTNSNGFQFIGYANSPTTLDSQIGAAARAEHADIVHTMTVPGTTTPITGAGVKVGIISNSYNILGGAAADVAKGYLPADGVTVLREGSAGDDDEGRAMAELIHQVAPGSSLYFASTGNGVDDFASSVQALETAGCTVIVDDIALTEPFFQLGSAAENAISAGIASGVTFVTSAGNYADAYYEHAFTTTQQTLLDGSVVQAMTFSNGTPYQSITATGGQYDTIDLQWDAPFYGTGGVASDQPDSVMFKVFDPTTSALIGTSQQVSIDGHLVAESELTLPGSNSTTNYEIAIYHADGTPDVSEIKYVLTGFLTGAGPGGRINDPDAGVGSGAINGHQLVPGEISVAAADVTNTPASGEPADFTEYFSSAGPGTLLFDAQGNRLAQPVIAGSPDVTGVDGVYTSVPGFTPFYGTSAAAPDVAGIIALMQQVNPDLTPQEASNLLAQSALPLSGEPDFLQGAGLVQADSAIALEEQVACYCLGTRILTARGEVEVEDLSIGDHVVTRNNGLQPIRWIGRRSYKGRFLVANRDLWPICFRQGSIADHVPQRDLWVSQHHAMYIDGVLIEAKDLRNDVSIYQADGAEQVDYFHVELWNHDVIIAEGAFSETFLDDGSRGMFRNAHEYHALYGPHEGAPVRYCAPRVDSGFEVQTVRERLAIRAGVVQEAVSARALALRGHVDKVDARRISGWAQTVENPEVPVCLEIYADGRMIGCTLANLYRADLQQAGLGSGRHGFEVMLPPGLTVSTGVVEVRRALDGAPLARSSAFGRHAENSRAA